MKVATLILLFLSFTFAQFKGWSGWTGWIADESSWCEYIFDEDASTVAHWILLKDSPDGVTTDVSGNGHTLTAYGGVGSSFDSSPYCGNAVES